MRPHIIKKVVTFSESEWWAVYEAAKQAGVDPAGFIKRAALDAAKGGK